MIVKYSPTGTEVVRQEAVAIPRQLVLHQNYPNPFNPSTTISYSVPETGNIRIAVYSMLGQEVVVLTDGVQNPGEYQVEWNGRGLASGVYCCRLFSAGTVRTIKLLLMQ